MERSKFTIEGICNTTQGKLLSPLKPCQIDDFLIDSRMLGNSLLTLFFAIKTDKNDGHLFVDDLFKRGVRNFVVTEISNLPENVVEESNVILVDDAVKALQDIAADYRRQLSYPIVGITGSNGKTIVKEWLYQLLSPKVRVARSPKSYNSKIGVALSLLSLPRNNCDLAIVEAGISMVGEMDVLENMIKPNVGIITNIGNAHIHNFKDVNQLLNEKLNLFENAEVVFYSSDYQLIDTALKTRFKDKTLVGKGSDFYLNKLNGSVSLFNNPASMENITHCLSFIDCFNYDIGDLKSKLSVVIPLEMRLEIKDGINNCLIINDSYSLDVKSFQIAVGELVRQKRYEEKSVIVSDFAEVDNAESDVYAQVADIVNNNSISQVVLIGETIVKYRSLFRCKVHCYDDTEDFLGKFNSMMFVNQAVLLKGARSFSFEKISNKLQKHEHETTLEVNVDVILNNLATVKSLLKPTTKMLVMVKAFSYGCGSVEIASVMQSHNVDYLAVAFVDEGIELREAGITLPIIVMNPEAADISIMIDYNLEPEIYSLSKLKQVCDCAKRQCDREKNINVHIKLDTGMHRLGFSESQIDEMLDIICNNRDYVTIASVFSHLAVADNADYDEFTHSQLENFETCANRIEERVGYCVIKHVLNSYGIARFADYQFDMVRLGVGLFGVEKHLNEIANLQMALQLKGVVAQVRDVKRGESVGYGLSWTAARDSQIAILPIGYADGYKVALSNKDVKVYINGNYCPIVGRVCMDMCFADVTGLNVKEGDEVEFFGNHVDIDSLAKAANTISYEIISTLSHRIKRVYYL